MGNYIKLAIPYDLDLMPLIEKQFQITILLKGEHGSIHNICNKLPKEQISMSIFKNVELENFEACKIIQDILTTKTNQSNETGN